jgi:hypothetical protein
VRAADTVLLGTFGVGSSPAGIAFDGKYMWIATQATIPAASCWPTTDRTVQTIHVDMRPTGVAFDGNYIWGDDQAGNSVTKVRVRDTAQIGTLPVGPGPTGIAFDGANIWVATPAGTLSPRGGSIVHLPIPHDRDAVEIRLAPINHLLFYQDQPAAFTDVSYVLR